MDDNHLSLYKTIFEQSPVSTQIFTPEGDMILVNKAWKKLWNAEFEQIRSYNILKDQQLVETGVMPYIKKAFTGKFISLPAFKYISSPTLSKKSEIPYRWLQAKMYPIRNRQRIITYIVLQYEDITATRESAEQTQRLAAIVESSDDAIISKTMKGIITSWNKGANNLFGYTAPEAIGQHITLLIPRELHKEEYKILRKLQKGERIKHYETIRVDKYGKKLHVSLSISPLKDAQGNVTGASKIARDITAQKKTTERIRESEERLRVALEAGEIGVWDWNIPENILTWTDRVYDIHGVTKKNFKVTYENFSQLIHKEDKKSAQIKIQQSLKNKEPFEAEFRIVTPSGEIRWLTTRASISYDTDGKPLRMLGATSNITHQKQIEQDKSDFLSMASHELKTPLTSMKIFIELLDRHLALTDLEKPKYFIARIHDQANRLTELTNDLLDVSRIETGKLKLNMDFFNMNSFITETVESIQATTDKHIIRILHNPSIVLCGDRYRLYQVLVNLLTNAIKYSPKYQEVLLNVEQTKNSVIISVADKGIGIKKSQQKKIFNRLYQVNDPEEKTYPGLGLGLYISKEIIERHNGKIWVESTKGKGSTFFLKIPLTASHETVPPPQKI